MKLSVITAAYNCEKYIKDLLDSLECQDLDKNEYEIIIVNDCSKDSTQKIIDEYCAKFSNIKSLINEENKGACYSRNRGIQEAKGDFIFVLDNDDYVAPNAFGTIFKLIDEKELDLVAFYNDSPSNDSHFNPEEKIIWNIKKYPKFFSGGIWQRIVKRSLIIDNKIFFRQGILGGEDTLWTLNINFYLDFSKAILIEYPIYHYRNNINSYTHNMRKTYPKILYNVFELSKIYRDMAKDFEVKSMPKKYVKMLKSRQQECAMQVMFWVTFCGEKKDIKEWYNKLKEEKLTPIRLVWYYVKPHKDLRTDVNHKVMLFCRRKYKSYIMRWFIHTKLGKKLSEKGMVSK